MDLSYGLACEAIREAARTLNKANPLRELIWARFKRILQPPENSPTGLRLAASENPRP